MIIRPDQNGNFILTMEALRHLGASAGDTLEVECLENGVVQLRRRQKTGKISDAFGLLHDPNGPSFTIEQINKAIEQGWSSDEQIRRLP